MASAPRTRTLAKAPGPAMRGMARGKTEMSARLKASSRSSSVSRSWWAKTISVAMRKRSTPPAMRRASEEIPRCPRSSRPKK